MRRAATATFIIATLLASAVALATPQSPRRVFRVPTTAAKGMNGKSFGLPDKGAKVHNWTSPRMGAVQVTIGPKGGERTIVSSGGYFVERTTPKKRLTSETWLEGQLGRRITRSYEGGKLVLSASWSGYDGSSITVTRKAGKDTVSEYRGKDYINSMGAMSHWGKRFPALLDKVEASKRPLFQLFGRPAR